MLCKGFSIFSSGSHFVQQSISILAILVLRHQSYISVKLFWNQATGLGGDVVIKVFSIFSSVAILFDEAEQV